MKRFCRWSYVVTPNVSKIWFGIYVHCITSVDCVCCAGFWSWNMSNETNEQFQTHIAQINKTKEKIDGNTLKQGILGNIKHANWLVAWWIRLKWLKASLSHTHQDIATLSSAHSLFESGDSGEPRRLRRALNYAPLKVTLGIVRIATVL